jgi:hypothetical protein
LIYFADKAILAAAAKKDVVRGADTLWICFVQSKKSKLNGDSNFRELYRRHQQLLSQRNHSLPDRLQ